MSRPDILMLLDRPPEDFAILDAAYRLHYASTPQARRAVIRDSGALFSGVITSGSLGLTRDEIDALPNIGIICCSGSGYDGIDTRHAAARGIAVTNSPGANTESVADHTVALLLSLVRGVTEWDGNVRRGLWSELQWERPTVSGKRLGLLGLGAVGGAVAKRLSGFDLDIAYHTRRPRPDVPYTWKATALELASEVDFLIATLPGNTQTRHIVNAAVLDALGPRGYLVNVGRGILVDNAALVDALLAGRIAGAALDVVEGEPTVPGELLAMPNVVITPHVAWLSPESREQSLRQVLGNLDAFFGGRPLLSPIEGARS